VSHAAADGPHQAGALIEAFYGRFDDVTPFPTWRRWWSVCTGTPLYLLSNAPASTPGCAEPGILLGHFRTTSSRW
jgi:hypothetical protein